MVLQLNSPLAMASIWNPQSQRSLMAFCKAFLMAKLVSANVVSCMEQDFNEGGKGEGMRHEGRRQHASHVVLTYTPVNAALYWTKLELKTCLACENI